MIVDISIQNFTATRARIHTINNSYPILKVAAAIVAAIFINIYISVFVLKWYI